MSERIRRQWPRTGLSATVAAVAMLAAPAWSHGTEEHAPAGKVAATETHHAGPRLAMPMMNPARGRELFVAKGCFACHAINGVGGHDATNLDAHSMDHAMNPFDFAAKMWTMAPAMIAAQEEAMDGQILFSGQELADIIAFVHDDEEQHHFSMDEIPAEMRKMMHHAHGPAPAHQKEIGHHHGEADKHD